MQRDCKAIEEKAYLIAPVSLFFMQQGLSNLAVFQVEGVQVHRLRGINPLIFNNDPSHSNLLPS